jgi:hypothetical protein
MKKKTEDKNLLLLSLYVLNLEVQKLIEVGNRKLNLE